MAGYIEDRWLKKRADPVTGRRERTTRWGSGKRYRVAGIPDVTDRSFTTLEDAKTWLATAQADVERNDFVDPRGGDMLLAEYIEEKYLPSRHDEPSTAASMLNRIDNHIVPLIGHVSLRAINATVLRTWVSQLLDRVSESTAEVIWIHLKAILNAAVEDDLIRKNPCNSKRTVKAPRAPERKAKAWNQPTASAVREGLQARYQITVDLGVGLGLRQGEAFALGLEDIDFDKEVVHIRRQLRWDYRARPYFCAPKSRKTRQVPLSPNLARRLRNHIEEFPPLDCTLPWRNPEPPTTPLEARQRKAITVRLLLTSGQGNRIFYRTWNDRSWKPALAHAGVIRIVGHKQVATSTRTRSFPIFEASREDMYHVCRHTFASVQLEAGESIVSVSQWLGHSNPSITLKHYAHFMPDAGRRGRDVMDSWFD